MAAYFHGISSEIQAVTSASTPSDHHGIQTLHLMNPSFLSSYSDHNQQQQQQQQQSPGGIFFFNTSNNTLNHNLLHPASADNGFRTNTSEFVPGYNIWPSFDQNSVDSSGLQLDVSEFRRPVVASPSRQGLSLTLSSQQLQPPGGSYDSNNNNNRSISFENDHRLIQAMMPSCGEEIRVSGNSPSSVSAASNGGQNTVLGSKYLQAAQELLDEVVNVGKRTKSETKEKMKVSEELDTKDGSSCGGNSHGGESGTKQGIELTTAQRQELQMKKAKLVNMLDEVEQRYRQYHTQMQIVVSSFEQAAGFGAAKSYTDLALRTISKQFRCLRDAISGQIKATSKSLGEEDCLGVKVEGSRLKYVDQQLRQQRALQQLGMLQHNAWRPQRGLPERAVSVLRAWLFEHFLHPYPKDSDKHILAKQTGLTRSQVSNWFINARVRLWKPMVEEMYLEELKGKESNGGTQDNSSKDAKKDSCSNKAGDNNIHTSPNTIPNSTILVSAVADRGGESSIQPPQPGFTLIRPSDLEGISQISPKKPRSSDNSHDLQNSPSSILSMDMDMKQRETSKEMINMINFGGGDRLISNNIGGFGGYNPIGEDGRFSTEQLAPRFGSNNNVSLTLGLQHCDNITLSASHHQNFIPYQNIQLGDGLRPNQSNRTFLG